MGCLLITFFIQGILFRDRCLQTFGQPRFVEGTSFFSGSKSKGIMLVKNVVKHKNKIVASDVDVTVVLGVKVKIKKSSVKIFQKRRQVKFF